jgi:hypothetical protein
MHGRVLGVVAILTATASFGCDGTIGWLVDLAVYLQITCYYFMLFDSFSPTRSIRNTATGDGSVLEIDAPGYTARLTEVGPLVPFNREVDAGGII